MLMAKIKIAHLISKLHFKDSNIAFSKPYISSATRSTCVTVTIKRRRGNIFLRFSNRYFITKTKSY